MFIVLHTGQTGVERGAHHGAEVTGLGIAGFMPNDVRDELGPIPPTIADRLTPCIARGYRPAVLANATICSAAIAIVPRIEAAEEVAGMTWLLQRIRGMRRPLLVCDPSTSVEDIASWANAVPPTCGSRRLFVTGPRGTRWAEGEQIARRIVRALGSSVSTSDQIAG